MKKERKLTHVDEPMGIVISNGERGEEPTFFSAYVWGPAPEPVTVTKVKAA